MAAPYRADQLGSFLRPPEILDARAANAEGRLGAAELQAIEDKAILQVLEMQRQVGVDVYSDGEFRRGSFLTSFADSVAGFGAPGEAVTWDWHGPEGGMVRTTARPVEAKLSQTRRLTGGEIAFMKEHAPGPYKITVPSANLLNMMGAFKPGVTDTVYGGRADLLQDIGRIIKNEIQAAVDEGVPYVQIDAPNYAQFCDEQYRQRMREAGTDPDQALDEAIAAENATLEVNRSDGVTLAFHICRGNNRSRWLNSGGYEPIAEKMFGSLKVDRFLLEYDTDRSGGFEPLRFIPKGTKVVLGLVTTKESNMESQDLLLRRIDEASKYVPVDDLALSPQCGFASVSGGNLLSMDDQRRKLELVVDTARKVWG